MCINKKSPLTLDFEYYKKKSIWRDSELLRILRFYEQVQYATGHQNRDKSHYIEDIIYTIK